MYIYQITNLINNKIYIGQTNNIKKRWSNHKNCNSPKMVIAKAIKKYGVENFKFEILLEGLTAEESDEAEVRLIQEKNSLVPNGYNVEKGGKRNNGISHYGADNSNAHLTEYEAQYILDNRNIPMYILYDDFSEKITYEQFKKIYHHQTYQNLTSHSEEYPYNFEFSNQFTSTNKLDYDEVCKIRERYRDGEYWLKYIKIIPIYIQINGLFGTFIMEIDISLLCLKFLQKKIEKSILEWEEGERRMEEQNLQKQMY